MKLIFFGSDEFALQHANVIMGSKHEIVACVTGPDRPQGRGMKVIVSPIKQFACQHQIPCLQPVTLKSNSIVDELKAFNTDVFVVVAYGRLLTQEVLDIPKLLCLNVHGSLLPKYRGAAPVNWAILNGDKETGVTVQKMVLSLDAGDILAQQRIIIEAQENAAQLRARMAVIGAELLLKVLNKGDFSQTEAQDEAQVTYAPKLNREMGLVNWGTSAFEIMNQVRGLQPWPGTYTFYNKKMIKITLVQLSSENKFNSIPGQIVKLDKSGIHVACQEGILLVKEVQPEAGKVMPAASFMAGYKLTEGLSLGV